MLTEKDTKEYLKQAYRLVEVISGLMFLVVFLVFFYLLAPNIPEKSEPVISNITAEVNKNKIENGIHIRTGLIDAEGLMTVVNNCTNCHSSKLIVQNRMDAEKWNSTIKWMQETQGLWDLGVNQEVIVNYLVKNYPVQKKGRRENLAIIEWYELKD